MSNVVGSGGFSKENAYMLRISVVQKCVGGQEHMDDWFADTVNSSSRQDNDACGKSWSTWSQSMFQLSYCTDR